MEIYGDIIPGKGRKCSDFSPVIPRLNCPMPGKIPQITVENSHFSTLSTDLSTTFIPRDVGTFLRALVNITNLWQNGRFSTFCTDFQNAHTRPPGMKKVLDRKNPEYPGKNLKKGIDFNGKRRYNG